jgi:hypothetical protein
VARPLRLLLPLLLEPMPPRGRLPADSCRDSTVPGCGGGWRADNACCNGRRGLSSGDSSDALTVALPPSGTDDRITGWGDCSSVGCRALSWPPRSDGSRSCSLEPSAAAAPLPTVATDEVGSTTGDAEPASEAPASTTTGTMVGRRALCGGEEPACGPGTADTSSTSPPPAPRLDDSGRRAAEAEEKTRRRIGMSALDATAPGARPLSSEADDADETAAADPRVTGAAASTDAAAGGVLTGNRPGLPEATAVDCGSVYAAPAPPAPPPVPPMASSFGTRGCQERCRPSVGTSAAASPMEYAADAAAAAPAGLGRAAEEGGERDGS